MINRLLVHRMSLRVSPLLVALALAVPALAGSMAALAFARQSPTDVPAGFGLSNTKSLAEFLAALCAQSYTSSFPLEAPFLGGNALAMSKMMTGMAITPSGDIDKDFVDMMVPHHQGAIGMAVLELSYGHNDRLKALAQEIIVTQQQEIAAMRFAVGEPLPPSKPSPIGPGARITAPK